jgi:hypothetical protein
MLAAAFGHPAVDWVGLGVYSTNTGRYHDGTDTKHGTIQRNNDGGPPPIIALDNAIARQREERHNQERVNACVQHGIGITSGLPTIQRTSQNTPTCTRPTHHVPKPHIADNACVHGIRCLRLSNTDTPHPGLYTIQLVVPIARSQRQQACTEC